MRALHFRHLLEKHELTARLFGEVNTVLAEQVLLLRESASVDADEERQSMVFWNESAYWSR